MAQIRNEHIIQPDIFADPAESATKLLKVLDMLETQLRDIKDIAAETAKTNPLESYRDVKKAETAIESFTRANDELKKVTEERVKITKELNDLSKKEAQDSKERAKTLAELEKAQQQLLKTEQETEKLAQQRGKTRAQEIKNETAQIRLSETLRRAKDAERKAKEREVKQAERNRSVTDEEIKAKLQEQKRAKERRDVLKAELILLDKEAGTLEKLAAKNTLLRIERGKLNLDTKEGAEALKRINKEIDRNNRRIRGNSDQLKKQKQNVGNYTQSVFRAIIQAEAFTAALGALKSGFGGLNGSLNANEESSQKLTEIQARLNASFDVLKNSVGATASAIVQYFTEERSAFSQAAAARELLDSLGDSWTGLGEKINTSQKAAGEAVKQQFELNKASRDLRLRIAELTGEVEKQNAIAGDSTKSYGEIADAALKAAQVQREAASLQTFLAQEQLDILNRQISARAQLSLEDVKTLSNAELVAKTDVQINDLLNQRLELNLELKESENALAVAVIENSKIQRENERDLFERKEDFAIDGFDSVKTANEKIITDDTKTLERRAAVLERTRELAEKSFAEQIRFAEEYTGRRLELAELVKLDDEAEIRRRLQLAQFDDVTAGVLLNIIRERKAVTSDLAELERDIAEERAEQLKRETDAEQALAEFRQGVKVEKAQELLTEEKNAGKRIELLKKLQEEEIKLQEIRRDGLLANTKLIEDERRKIIEESENEIRKIRKKSIDDQKTAEKEALEQRKKDLEEVTEQGTEAVADLLSKRSSLRESELNRQIENAKSVEAELIAAAERGDKRANESIVFEREKQAELEADRQREARRQRNIELSLAAVKLFSAKAGSGDRNAFLSTVTEISALRSFVSSLPAFYSGTEGKTVGEVLGSPMLPQENKDQYIARVDKDEIILSPEESANYKQALRAVPEQKTEVKQVNIAGVAELSAKMDSVRKAIEAQPVYTGGHYNDIEKAFVETVRVNNNVERKHYKANGII